MTKCTLERSAECTSATAQEKAGLAVQVPPFAHELLRFGNIVGRLGKGGAGGFVSKRGDGHIINGKHLVGDLRIIIDPSGADLFVCEEGGPVDLGGGDVSRVVFGTDSDKEVAELVGSGGRCRHVLSTGVVIGEDYRRRIEGGNRPLESCSDPC